jgi:hypothetical protein
LRKIDEVVCEEWLVDYFEKNANIFIAKNLKIGSFIQFKLKFYEVEEKRSFGYWSGIKLK